MQAHANPNGQDAHGSAEGPLGVSHTTVKSQAGKQLVEAMQQQLRCRQSARPWQNGVGGFVKQVLL